MKINVELLRAFMAAAALLFASGPASRSQEFVNISYYFRTCTTETTLERILESCTAGIDAAKACRGRGCTLENSEGGTDNRAIAAMYVRRGRVYDQLRQFDRALADFEAAVSHDPASITALQLRGIERIGIGFLQRDGDTFNRGIEDLQMVISQTPDDAKAYYFLGFAAFAKNDANAALGYVERTIALNPTDYDALYLRGMVRLVLRQADAALSDFNRAIEIAPGKSLAYVGRASLNYFVVRDYKNALLDFARGAWLKLDGAWQGLIIFAAIAALPLLIVRQFGRRHGAGAALATLAGGVGNVLARLSRRSHALLCTGLVLFLISAAVTQVADWADESWKSFWNALGVTDFLIPGSGSVILAYLVLQAFAVRTHQLMAGTNARSLTAFWRAYVRFTGYAMTLFLIGFIGILLPRLIAIQTGGMMMEYVAGVPAFWIVLIATACTCVLLLSLIGGCSLMLPAAAMQHPLSPRAAFRLARDKSWRLNWTISGFTLLCTLLGWLMDQGLLFISEGAAREGGRGLATLLAAYVAVALNATALSLFYAEITEPEGATG